MRPKRSDYPSKPDWIWRPIKRERPGAQRVAGVGGARVGGWGGPPHRAHLTHPPTHQPPTHHPPGNAPGDAHLFCAATLRRLIKRKRLPPTPTPATLLLQEDVTQKIITELIRLSYKICVFFFWSRWMEPIRIQMTLMAWKRIFEEKKKPSMPQNQFVWLGPWPKLFLALF